MKNIKNIALLSISIFSMFDILCIGDNIGKVAAEALSEGLKEAAKTVGSDATQEIVKAAQIFSDTGIEATKITTDGAVELAKITSDNVAKASKELGADAVKALYPVVGAVIFFYGVKDLVNAGKDFYAYVYPSEEKVAKIEEAREKIQFYEAKRNFRDCLIKNIKGQMNGSGLPSACEELANLFIIAGSKDAFIEMSENFKFAHSRT